jgi:hypothetical protein
MFMTRLSSIAAAAVAALLAIPGVAQAKIPVLDLGDDICGFMPIQITHGSVHGFSNFNCETGNFIGVVGTVKGQQFVIASIQINNKPGDQFLLQLSYPLVDGGTWSVRYTSDGYKSKLYKSGTYTVTR